MFSTMNSTDLELHWLFPRFPNQAVIMAFVF